MGDTSECSGEQPPSTFSCSATADCEYAWAAVDFEACPTACGTAESTLSRSVSCVNQDGASASDTSRCTHDTMPLTSHLCPATDGCVDAAVIVETVLQLDFASLSTEIAMVQFKTDFVTELSSVLSVDSSRIHVLEVRPGSIVVQYEIMPSLDPAASNPAALVSTLEALAADSSSSLYSTTILAQVDRSRAVGIVPAPAPPGPTPTETDVDDSSALELVAETEDNILGMSNWPGFFAVVVVAVAMGVALFYMGWCSRGRLAGRVSGIGNSKLAAAGEHNV